jgi:predicted RND superfamily exporter protein
VETSVAGAPVTAMLTGVPVLRAEILERLKREQVIFLVAGGLVGAAIALLMFRSVAATVIVTCATGTGTLWTLGLMGAVGEAVNPVNSVVPTLVLIIGFTDAVHMLHAARRGLRAGTQRRDAARRAIVEVGPACALTSLTTAIGFASLATARVDVIARFGLTAAGGAVMSFAAVLVVVPLLAGTWYGARIAGSPRTPIIVQRGRRAGADALAAVLRHPRSIAVVGVLLTIALAGISTQLRASSSLREGTPSDSEAGRAVAVVDEHFGGVLSLIVLVEWADDAEGETARLLDVLAAVEGVLAAQPTLGRPLSLLDVLAALPGPADDLAAKASLLPIVPAALRDRLYRPDRRRALVTANMPDTGTRAYAPVLASVRRDLEALQARAPGFTLTLSGNPVAVGVSSDLMVADLAKSLAVAAGVIGVVLMLAFRSVVLGLISIVPNAFPLVAAGAALVLAGHPLTVTGVICFCVCLGIAVDDTIHVVTRFRRERAAAVPVAAALDGTLRTVGAALLTTTATLVGGFACLLLSEIPLLRLFGVLCAIALLAALAGDLVLLPALLALTGPRTDPTEAARRVPGPGREAD